jgi:uncharacterized membrane protein YraQ (UPF0718 family)
MDVVVGIVVDFWLTLTAMSPYLLFGFAIAGTLSVFISPEFIETHLGSRGLWPVVKASLFGVPLPLCSCGVIPVTASLRKHGASRGASISFLLSTPQTGVDSFLVTLSLLGPVFAIFRPVVAFITGLIGGVAVQAVVAGSEDAEKNAEQESECQDPCCKKSSEPKILRILKYAFLTLPEDIARPMLAGIFIAALIAAFVPEGFIIEGTETVGPFGMMLIMMALGIPVYVCATASVPLAAVMIAKGISPGAVLVFLMTGPATNAAAFATIWKMMGSRTAIVYLLTVIVCALGSGLILDFFFPGLSVSVQEHFHEMAPSAINHILAVVLLTILAWGVYKKAKGS